MGQDDNEQYSGLALYLATDYFMDHQSKDVRLLVACCIADVFRIFAPDAPYTEAAQLKVSNIFHSIIDVVLVGTKNKYATQNFLNILVLVTFSRYFPIG